MRDSHSASVGVRLFATLAFSLLALILPGASRAQDNKTKTVANQPQTEEIVDSLNTKLALLTVTVTDTQGRPVVNLKHNAFTVFDDKEPQQIAFFIEEDKPASAVAFDRSERTLAGIVYFTNNTPRDLDQFPVELFTKDKRKRVAATTLNAHGRFALTGIKPAEYLVKFTWLPDHCTLWYRVDLRKASKNRARVIMDAACGNPHPLSDLPEN